MGFYRYNQSLSPSGVSSAQPRCPAIIMGPPLLLLPSRYKNKNKGGTKEKRHSVHPAPGSATPPPPRPPPTRPRTPFPLPPHLHPTPGHSEACHPAAGERPADCVMGGRPPPSFCLSDLVFLRANISLRGVGAVALPTFGRDVVTRLALRHAQDLAVGDRVEVGCWLGFRRKSKTRRI